MGKLFVASLKMLYRNKQALFWALAFPIIFAVVFGLFDFDQAPEVRIAMVADEGSPVTPALSAGLDGVESFDVERRSDLETAKRDLSGGEVDVVVSIPAASTSVEVFYSAANFTTNQFALTTIQRIVDGVNLRAAGVSQPMVTVEERAVQAKTVRYYDFLLPGLVAMGVMTFSIMGMAATLARFREQRILKRILATPLRPVRFVAAQVGARLVLALVQVALILAVGVYIFDGHVYGNVLWIFVLATFANLIFLNLGFAVAGRAKDVDSSQGIANSVALPMMFLSGTFFPTETLPEVMQWVVKLLPLTPLLEAMRKVAIDAESITATGPQLLQLSGWVVVSFLLAWRMFRFSETRA